MPSVTQLIAELLQYGFRAPVIGGAAVVLVLFRELYTGWKPSIARAFLDLLTVALGLILTAVVALQLSSVTPHA